MKTLKQQLFKASWLGAIGLISIYTLAVSLAILYTENRASEQRLSIVGPYHLQEFSEQEGKEKLVSPLLRLYRDYQALPKAIQADIKPDWLGVTTLQFDDDSEFCVLAYKMTMKGGGSRILYAVEDINATEWQDIDLAVVEISFAVFGTLLFLLVTYLIRLQAAYLAKPLQCLVKHISDQSLDHEETKISSKNSCLEILSIESAVNHYRSRMKQMLNREQSFTRYVSHELRTPMMVIKGNVAVLKKHTGESKQLRGIDLAIEQVTDLTYTFLSLARESLGEPCRFEITAEWLNEIVAPFSSKSVANKTELKLQLLEPCVVYCDEVLLKALIRNLLDNAINCTYEGQVSLFLSQSSLEIVDSGCGLDEKPRGYEGFGFGLQIVADICTKYQWQFSLTQNSESGCTAKIVF
ncbi:sensor histidine kinase [Pseudoalteromonas piscicida]|uniref:sensor histidine kinase n=1 Tax=Pseudoalteromonas piscicida TaxID=43662 RepID=UPI000696CB12|nr:HAMP domain-containing sensor histidine kinase [Pseudoalteromonas piscicida]